MQSDWLRTFWPISQEPEFSQIWDLCRNTANDINLHYITNSVKINDKIFQCIQKNPFMAHFPNFGDKKFCSGKSSSVMHNFIWVSSIMPKFRKNMIQFQENAWTDGRTDGRTDRPYFIGPFWLMPVVQKCKIQLSF